MAERTWLTAWLHEESGLAGNTLMSWAEEEDWLAGQMIVVPHRWRDDDLWYDMQTQAHNRIGVALRAIYADTLLQPLSPQLAKLIYQIRMQREISHRAG